MTDKIKDEKVEFLLKGIMSLETQDEFFSFFTDLCTVSEIQEMSKRFYAAKLLNDGRIYSDIAEQTGLSTATISRVNRCLKYGSDGYVTALKRLEKRR